MSNITIISRKVKARDIVAACNTSPVRALATLPTIRAAWARYAINNGLSFRTYTLGFQLLEEGDTWLVRGFDALLEAIPISAPWA